MLVEEEIYVTVGRRVRTRREQLTMTQDDLARAVDLTRTSISNIEQGRQKIQVHMLYRLAHALGLVPDALLPLTEPTTTPDLTTDPQVLALPPPEQDWVQRVLAPSSLGVTDEPTDSAPHSPDGDGTPRPRRRGRPARPR